MANHELGFSMTEARERGYLGGFRLVSTDEALMAIRRSFDLLLDVKGRVFPEPFPGGECEDSSYTEKMLEHAAEQLRRAAAMIDHQRLQLRDGTILCLPRT